MPTTPSPARARTTCTRPPPDRIHLTRAAHTPTSPLSPNGNTPATGLTSRPTDTLCIERDGKRQRPVAQQEREILRCVGL